MKITRVNETQIIDTPHRVDVRKLYDRENAQAVHITLKPGEALKSSDMVAHYLLLYEMSGDPENLLKVVNYDYNRTNVTSS